MGGILKSAKRRDSEENKPYTRKTLTSQGVQLLRVLKEDLIEYYRENEFTMSVAPLVEQHEAEVTKFYVRPPMMAYKKPNAFGQKKQSEEISEENNEKTRIRSYRELILNGSDPYKGIYVTADAGMGKTSFAKMLAVTWCETHASKDSLIRKSLESRDIETIKKFDFLFLIKLRDFKNSCKCSLDEMILEMMESKLQHKSQYTEELLEKVLCNERCLIIVDGLDEWIHHHSCQRGEVIPHRRPWPGCTVLTTTRPWKLSTARLSKADIDQQVEISQRDEITARELESRAIAFLNENQRQNVQMEANSKTKTVTDFEKSVPEKILGHFLYIPFVLLQMICLWFGNNPIGKSLCEVYSNIIELTLTRWLVKIDSGHTNCKCDPAVEYENIEIKCMKDNTHCQCYMPLLLKIGQLAFSTLFGVKREESLLFEKKNVLEYLSEEDLKQCMDMGLLSQVKDTSSLTILRLQLYFIHKTLHEFFCALFIVTNWNNVDAGTMSVKETILNMCASVSNILEMSQVFVFVCGLNPDVHSDISRHLAMIVDTDQSVNDYRNNCVEGYSRLLEDYQRMQISCFLECTRNQHLECKIVVEDMVVKGMFYMEEDEKQALEKILSDSACSMKSLTLRGIYATEDSSSEGRIVRILEQTECSCLERLSVYKCKSTLFQSALTTAAHTLKYLKLKYVSLTAGLLSAISRLNNLQGLYLHDVQVLSDTLNAISDCISGCMSLQKLRLDLQYKHSDTDEKHEQTEASYNYLLRTVEAKTMLTCLTLLVDYGHQHCVLDLSKHDKLQELHLRLRLTELHINTKQLVKCEVYKMGEIVAPAVLSLLAELHGAPVLETLRLADIRNSCPRIDITALPRLTEFTLLGCDLRESTVTLILPELTEFTMAHCDLRGSTVTLSPEMTSLKTITLKENTVYISCCRTLFLSISSLLQHLTVVLWKINMVVREWRELFLSISKLPQPTVKLWEITLPVGEWRELLFDILGKLPKSISVEMKWCEGPSEEEWRHIVDTMKASQAFSVTRTDLNSYIKRNWIADIAFDTVVI